MTKVTLIGAGALGSYATMLMRNLDIDLTVVDFDKVESKNLMSQFHTAMGLRKNKALALQQTMQSLYRSKLLPVPHRLTSDNVDQLLGGADLLVDCVDNAPTRKLIQTYAQANEVPCLHAALAAGGTFGQVAWTDQFEIEEAGAPGQATCEDGEALPFIVLVSGYLATEVENYLNGKPRKSCNISPAGIFWF